MIGVVIGDRYDDLPILAAIGAARNALSIELRRGEGLSAVMPLAALSALRGWWSPPSSIFAVQNGTSASAVGHGYFVLLDAAIITVHRLCRFGRTHSAVQRNGGAGGTQSSATARHWCATARLGCSTLHRCRYGSRLARARQSASRLLVGWWIHAGGATAEDTAQRFPALAWSRALPDVARELVPQRGPFRIRLGVLLVSAALWQAPLWIRKRPFRRSSAVTGDQFAVHPSVPTVGDSVAAASADESRTVHRTGAGRRHLPFRSSGAKITHKSDHQTKQRHDGAACAVDGT